MGEESIKKISSINNSLNIDSTQKAYMSFCQFADSINKMIPDKTYTISDKENVISLKQRIMDYPGCPSDTRLILQREINIIKEEINKIKQKEQQNKSIFAGNNKNNVNNKNK